MFKYIYACLLMLFIVNATAQDLTMVEQADTTAVKKWDAALDVFSRYIWRGQTLGADFPVLQPAFNYSASDKLTIGVWATTNLKYNYYYSDNATPNYSHQEFDVGVSYQISDYLTVSVWDYYWPSWHSIADEDNNYFNYGADGVKTVDASLEFDFSDGYQYPFNALVSTFVLGNDFRYDAMGENPRQNFTTYMEVGYTFYDIFSLLTTSKLVQNIDLDPSVGAVLNNQAGYYEAADYNRVSFINMAVRAHREFEVAEGINMPISVNYTHNAAKRNTEIDGRDFVTLGVSFYY